MRGWLCRSCVTAAERLSPGALPLQTTGAKQCSLSVHLTSKVLHVHRPSPRSWPTSSSAAAVAPVHFQRFLYICDTNRHQHHPVESSNVQCRLHTASR